MYKKQKVMVLILALFMIPYLGVKAAQGPKVSNFRISEVEGDLHITFDTDINVTVNLDVNGSIYNNTVNQTSHEFVVPTMEYEGPIIIYDTSNSSSVQEIARYQVVITVVETTTNVYINNTNTNENTNVNENTNEDVSNTTEGTNPPPQEADTGLTAKDVLTWTGIFTGSAIILAIVVYLASHNRDIKDSDATFINHNFMKRG